MTPIKTTTARLILKYLNNNQIYFYTKNSSLSYILNDKEIKELVEQQYGFTPVSEHKNKLNNLFKSLIAEVILIRNLDKRF